MNYDYDTSYHPNTIINFTIKYQKNYGYSIRATVKKPYSVFLNGYNEYYLDIVNSEFIFKELYRNHKIAMENTKAIFSKYHFDRFTTKTTVQRIIAELEALIIASKLSEV